MKKIKICLAFIVFFIICDFVLIFIDDGNHQDTVSYEATVLSCTKRNDGLDTYYAVEYEYVGNDDKIVSGKDNYYLSEVAKGDKITINKKVTVVSNYAKYIGYAIYISNIALGVSLVLLVVFFIKYHNISKSL